jgi:hypothetical protein
MLTRTQLPEGWGWEGLLVQVPGTDEGVALTKEQLESLASYHINLVWTVREGPGMAAEVGHQRGRLAKDRRGLMRLIVLCRIHRRLRGGRIRAICWCRWRRGTWTGRACSWGRMSRYGPRSARASPPGRWLRTLPSETGSSSRTRRATSARACECPVSSFSLLAALSHVVCPC